METGKNLTFKIKTDAIPFLFPRDNPTVKRQLLTAYLAARFAYTHVESLFPLMEDNVRPK